MHYIQNYQKLVPRKDMYHEIKHWEQNKINQRERERKNLMNDEERPGR